MARDIFGRDHRKKRDDEAEIRVTDRRRILLDDDESNARDAEAEAPSLKPSYVEELEARTKAAEQKTLEVQSRFEQLRKQLQSETDETRQRLNRAADERAQREKADFIAGLLPVLDNLQRATDAAEAGRHGRAPAVRPVGPAVTGTLQLAILDRAEGQGSAPVRAAVSEAPDGAVHAGQGQLLAQQHRRTRAA